MPATTGLRLNYLPLVLLLCIQFSNAKPLAQDPATSRPKATMWHGPASHSPLSSPSVVPRMERLGKSPLAGSKRQDSAGSRPKATMWHGPASYALLGSSIAVPPLKRRQDPAPSLPKATMWHGPASYAPLDLPTPAIAKRQDPTGSRPKATMWHGPASYAPLDNPTPVVANLETATQLNTTPFSGLKPLPGLPSPAAPLPVSPFDPKPNHAKPNGTMSVISSATALALSAAATIEAAIWQAPFPESNEKAALAPEADCKAPYQLGVSASTSKGTCIQYREVATKTNMVNCQGCPPVASPTDVDSSTSSAFVGFGGLFGPGPMIFPAGCTAMKVQPIVTVTDVRCSVSPVPTARM